MKNGVDSNEFAVKLNDEWKYSFYANTNTWKEVTFVVRERSNSYSLPLKFPAELRPIHNTKGLKFIPVCHLNFVIVAFIFFKRRHCVIFNWLYCFSSISKDCRLLVLHISFLQNVYKYIAKCSCCNNRIFGRWGFATGSRSYRPYNNQQHSSSCLYSVSLTRTATV